ncbi:hypothetical protein [Fortiea contorta]|uniref:hypothetical protein n=1 Tax=Fortiea contorta TaxID=1892405 RepID=UPI00034D5EE3|nr:hypothetical protein [Fortiea contorta]
MKGTVFVELPCADCEAEALSGEVAFLPTLMEEALQKFITNQLHIGTRNYKTTYTASHYGDENQIWDYSHYETYEPTDSSLPSMIILRYRPRNLQAA